MEKHKHPKFGAKKGKRSLRERMQDDREVRRAQREESEKDVPDYHKLGYRDPITGTGEG